MRLKNKVAVITGAAGNIGASTARLFSEQGASLVLVDARPEPLEALAATLDSEALVVPADVTSAADNQRIADDAVRHFGGMDILFANAGIEGAVAPPADQAEDVYERVMDVNVRGVFLGLKIIVPRMRAGASVVITSSIMGLMGAPRNMPYTASKHAVVGLMRSAAAAEASRGIRVNTVHPGMVESEMLRRLIARHPDPAAQEKALLARIKLGRFVHPEEIAQAVMFLASDESRMITSQTLLVDGGYLD